MTPTFLTDETKAAIVAHAESLPNEEVVGLILSDGTVIPSENVIEGSGLTENGVELTKATGCLVDEDFVIEYEDRLSAIYHTHWDEKTPGYLSFTDIDQSRFHQIPYLLYHTEFKVWDYFDPLYYHPFPLHSKGNPLKINHYLGWPFDFGRSDCATIIKAYLKNVCGHEFPDYPRPPDGEWYKKPEYQKMYLELFQDPVNGFFNVNTSIPKKNDVILMRFFGSLHPCHVGVMVDDKSFLHLLQPGHLSEVVPFGGAWKRGLHSVWRLRE